MKKLALERIRMPRSAGLPILFVFLIAITSNCLRASQAVLGPITSDATITDDLDDSKAANPEFLLAEDESDDTPNPALAENAFPSIEPVIFSFAFRTADLAAVQVKRSTVLRL
jgi:hypothetical protein